MPKQKIQFQFRGLTTTGKQFVASTFFETLIGISETLEIEQQDVRILSRSLNDSWYVYGNDRYLMEDVKTHQRTHWMACITREVVS